MFTKIIGWTFVLICPFMGGAFITMAYILYNGLPTEYISKYFLWYSIIWFLLYSIWFEGSKYQKIL